MHRFHLPPEQCLGPTLLLQDREAHHALHVLRLKPGDTASVLDGAGHDYLAEVDRLSTDQVALRVLQKLDVPPPPCSITLIQGIPKGKSFDLILQKATELGVGRIIPLLSDRVVTHLDPESSSTRLERWRQTAVEAMKQCGTAWLPEIGVPCSPREFVARKETWDLSLIASLQPGAQHPRRVIDAFITERGCRPASICVWVGPEGDFTPAEMDLARNAEARPITLGRLILRSETAAIYCLSILNYELQPA